MGRTDKIQSGISPTHSLNFTGVKKCNIWLRFSTPFAFDASWFRNGARYRKS